MFPNILPLYVEVLKLSAKSALKENYCAALCNDRPSIAPTMPHFPPAQNAKTQ